MDRAQLEALAPEIAYDVRMMTGTAVRQQIERAELERSKEHDTGRTRVVSFAVTESCLVRTTEEVVHVAEVAEALLAAWT